MTNSISKIKKEIWKPTFINNVEQEEWRYVFLDSNQTNYEVSSFGQVRNSRSGKILKPSLNGGYHHVLINKKGYRVHRLVAYAFLFTNGDRETLVVNHLDGNKLNNKASNLEFCTYQQNTVHAYENNLVNPNPYKIKVNQFDLNGVFIDSYG